MNPVLRVRNLSVSYQIDGGRIHAVRDFHIEIAAGEIVGVVGESGSGKSTIANAIMHYLPANGRIESGSLIEFQGVDLTRQSLGGMRGIWAKDLKLVPQNPGAALNPSMRIGDQLVEAAQMGASGSDPFARARVLESLSRVDLPDPYAIVNRYPHQLSGGQQQRIMIAMALITSPRLLILDEPTTNLDVTTEATILDLVKTLIRQEGAAALYITHNLGVVAQLCDRALVMYSGEILEDAPVADLFAHPLNPYTIGLLNSIPRIGQTKHDRPLASIPGSPALIENPNICVYSDRCPLAIEICRTAKPPLEPSGSGRLVRCHRWQEVAAGLTPDYPTQSAQMRESVGAGADASHPTRPAQLPTAPLDAHPNLLEVAHLSKQFTERGSRPIRAVEDISLSIQQGRTYGLVGESGSGKTTLARMIIGLTEPSSGKITLMGADITGDVNHRSREVLAQLQMVFQNPQMSLNPYHTVGEALRRPLMTLAHLNRANADAEVARLLTAVSLRPDYATRFPDELSGGEKQRVAIARAFASNPDLVVCDEPISALDASVQSAVLNLLVRLQEEMGAAYLFISHDLAVVGYLADYVAVMYLGELFEVSYARDLFAPPMHPYTEALISAIPVPDPTRLTNRIALTGDIPSPRSKPTGCAFHTRCPHKIGAICETDSPQWQSFENENHIRCHRTPQELAEIQAYMLNTSGSDR